MKEITLQEAALAWAQGKRVEAGSTGGDEWLPIDPVGECLRGTHSQTVFGCRNEYKFRLAPEPPAKRYRPWTPEEVPLDAWYRTSLKSISRLCAVTETRVKACSTGDWFTYEQLWDLAEHSIDNGKTWLPCGVEVEA
jgi:hypothetical protein